MGLPIFYLLYIGSYKGAFKLFLAGVIWISLTYALVTNFFFPSSVTFFSINISNYIMFAWLLYSLVEFVICIEILSNNG